ncbi:hypothetical protein ABPG75_001705 [Micractinium tetrahymenae]
MRHDSSVLGRRDVHAPGITPLSVALEHVINSGRTLLDVTEPVYSYPYPICCPAGKTLCPITFTWPVDPVTLVPAPAESQTCCRRLPTNRPGPIVPTGNEACVPASKLQSPLPAGLIMSGEPLDPSYNYVVCKQGKCLCRQGNTRQCVDNNGKPACVLQQGNTNPLIGPFNQYSPGGPCCRTGFKDCDGLATNGCEVDVMNDAENCGCCSVESPLGSGVFTCRCAENEMCKAGKCGCRFGFKPCQDGLKTKCIPKDACCAATQATDCPGQHTHCSGVGGQCVCDVDPTGVSVWADCTTETLGCETDLQTSNQHCGSCNHDCGCTMRCEKGDCVCDTPNYGYCGEDTTVCQDLPLDAHCGPECEQCDKGQQCQWDGTTSQWGCACPDGTMPDFLTEEANCGACGHACNVAAGEVCGQGECKCPTDKDGDLLKLCGSAGCQACCVDADCGDPLLKECDTITDPASYTCKDKCLASSCTGPAGAVDCCSDESPTNPAICIEDKCAYCAEPKH